jgi:hypothetical protein
MNKTPTEHDEQVAVFRWAAWAQREYPELALLHAIPNGGQRHVLVAKKLKAEGVKPGVPDVFLPVARGRHHGLYIEMKRVKGSSISNEQKKFIAELEAQGYRAEVCRGADEAIRLIQTYIMAGPIASADPIKMLRY